MSELNPTAFGKLDYYQRIGVDRSIEQSALKKAYRKQTLVYHPDRHPETKKAEATECFQFLEEANRTLSTAVNRAQYDAWLRTASPGSTYGSDSEDNAFSNIWLPGTDFKSRAINLMTAGSLILLFTGLLLSATLKSAYARCDMITKHMVDVFLKDDTLVDGFNRVLKPYRLDITTLTLLMIVVADYLGVGSDGDEFSRRFLGGMYLWIFVAVMRGVRDPKDYDVIGYFWWDTAITSGLFSFWFWISDMALIPSVLWSFFTAFGISAALVQVFAIDDAKTLMDFSRRKPAQTFLMGMVPLTLWSLQHSWFFRGIACVYFTYELVATYMLCVADPHYGTTGTRSGDARVEGSMSGWHLVQTQAFVIYIYCWSSYALIWSFVATCVWWLVQGRLCPSSYSATRNLFIILFLYIGYSEYL